MKLYYVPQTRSMRPRWLLEEMGIPYELVRLDATKGETRSEEYLRVNPMGHVPYLVDGEVSLAESGAICTYLADKFPEKKMAPPIGAKERGAYLQWMFYAMGTAEPPIALAFRHTVRLPEPERIPKVVEQARAALVNDVAPPLEKHLSSGREFLVGEALSAADVMVGHTFMWGRRMKLFGAADLPAIDAWLQKLRVRPALVRASAD